MGTVEEALDEAKAEIEKLKVDYQSKAQLSETLRRAHNEQLIKIQEASLKAEKLNLELNGKQDELASTKQMYEELMSNLKEKETIVKHLRSANDTIRADYSEKLQKCEEENRGLALALDGANATSFDQEQKIHSLKIEIEGLKEFVSVSQKKSSTVAEKKAKASKELKQNDDMLLTIEEENRKLADQLKWKKEQFGHLEEAHRKLRQQLQQKEKEWEKERDTLLDEISTLQMNLDSQVRISEDIQSRLQRCNQALAHEESRRKHVEVQLAESKTSFEDVCSEYEESKSLIESLTSERDKEIASLRNLLGTRDTHHKEMEYQFRKLEQENQELMASVKELQEARIQEAGASSSFPRLRKNPRKPEQVSKVCSSNLKAKEAEWASKLEELTGELNCCKSSLQSKDTLITELQRELETCHSLTLELTLQNEETSMMLLVLKSQFLELHQRIVDYCASVELEKREGVNNISSLMEQLGMKNEAVVKVQRDLEKESEKVAMLSARFESLNSTEEQKNSLQREVDTLKEMLKEASTSQIHFKEQVMQTKSDLKRVQDALDRANEELAEKFCEGNEMEFELQVWKSVAEKLEANLEANHQMRRQVEVSLLAQTDVEFNLKQEKESLELLLAEKDKGVDELQQQVFRLNQEVETWECSEQEWVRKELERAILAQVDAERNHKNEKETLHQLVEDKDHRIDDLQQLVKSLENEFDSSNSSFLARLSEMQTQVDMFLETWEKIRTAEILKEIEIQERNLMIVELESDLSNLRKKVENLETQLSSSVGKRTDLEAELEAKRSELSNLKLNHDRELSSSDVVIKKLNKEKTKIVDTFVGLSGRVNTLFKEDMLLSDSLKRMLQNCDSNNLGTDLRWDDELFDPVKENKRRHPLTPSTKVEAAIHDERSPLRSLNS